ncbi:MULTISPECIES: cofactor-independent phosphoglycerate mutase [Anaerostipes]|uniref:cofactor-independent phosphoglycerate mutase n=1 Tax=Anaerostipes TaxID=207244 RepID=UPI001C1DE962|nr:MULTISPECIES: cofactor-independent phosphoglycerate mutase [Anaerostipes]MCI5622227.1 cofactor-independent phosphoglycerate mutase [Anaerostipes sp.]MDY2725658.1 cofactor-independent phosphoglycerate mutase [Anaerostipes faecalis]
MKYVVILGDGMADEPIESLNGKTPLQTAEKPVMDEMARTAEQGIAYTVPENLPAGSDVANLSMLGYDPQQYYSGRSPLEALSIGVDMKDTDIALRCNVVTVTEDGEYEDKEILDHSAGEITSEEAEVLIEAVKKELETDEFKFYPGVSYRHLTIWDKGQVIDLIPPHDILGKKIGDYLPTEPKLKEMMKKSFDILNHHPINEERAKKGLNKANSIWFWGAGTKPALDNFKEKTGMNGAMVSAVDLLKGIAVGAGMRNLDVEGANGGLDTNYHGKAMAAVKSLLENDDDFAYIHVEAPDEMGHQGNVENKIKSIEYLDSQVVKVVKEELEKAGEEFRILIGPDHPTPIAIRTHSKEPIPFMIYDSTKKVEGQNEYSEETARKTGLVVEHAYELMNRLLQK